MTEKLESQLDSKERIPGHPNYFEQNGLRTYGDDQDHNHEPPVRALTDVRSQWLMGFVAVFLEVHVLAGHGLSLDWLPTPHLPIWYVAWGTSCRRLIER